AYRVIAGADPRDPDVPPVGIPEVSPPEFSDLRIAWASTFPGVPVAAPIRDALRGLAVELERLGARVEERLPEVSFRDMAKLRELLHQSMRTAFSPGEDEPPVSLGEYFTALDRRDKHIYDWELFFGEWDAL